MNKKRTLGPSAMLNPVPVIMLSCKGREGIFNKNNIITLAWAGTVNSDPPMLSVSVRKSRFSYEQIVQSKEFAINLVDKKLLKACDYCGVKSGRDTDKFSDCNLTAIRAEGTSDTPAIDESPVNISCKVHSITDLGSHVMFIAEIIEVAAQENLFDKNGKLMLNKAGLVAYSHGEYFTLSGPEGFFGFSVASKKILKRRMKRK
jgi:flavin reductase (DIM6/NTAB) family NADH-FMN oxidoreductase RutF